MKTLSIPHLSAIFFRLGSIGFGGPIALVSLMQKEFCVSRQLITLGEFNEAYVLTKLFPGPLASQMAAWIGYRLAGRWGAFVAGVSFLLPAFCLMIALSLASEVLQKASWLSSVLFGMRVAALVIICESVEKMFVPYRRKIAAWIVALSAGVALWIFPKAEPVIVVAGGMCLILAQIAGWRPLLSLSPVLLAPVLLALFWVHFKVAVFVFGTGLAIIPFLESEVVEVWKWLSHEEFLNGLALGQVTPGPITITSTYIGFKVAGMSGAVAATLGMFLPGILTVAFLFPLIQERVRRSVWAPTFSLGAISAVIGCLVVSVLLLGRQTLTASNHYAFFLALWFAARVLRIPSWAIILLGAVGGVVLTNLTSMPR